MHTPRPTSLVVALPFVIALVAGCGAVPSPSPASPGPSVPSAGPSTPDPWLEVDPVQPSAVTSAPSLEPGYLCHPCHFLAENQLFGVGATPGGLVAVGVQQPPAQAVAFSSADGTGWAPLDGFTAADGSTAIAVASSGPRMVIVGSDASGAAAWASGGGAWTAATGQRDLLVPYGAGAMTSVVALDGGFVAGGYADDPPHAGASAAAWRSTDGLAWRRDPAVASFAGGRIWGLASRDGTLVAVGTSGDPNYGPAAAWRWTASTGWQAAAIGPDAEGVMRAVAAGPSGFVAVGTNGHDDGAMAWTSPDGRAWTAAPDQPALRYYSLPLRMQAVAAAPGGFVAGGWRSDAGKGSAVTWTSADGVTWQGPAWESSFSGGQIRGVAVVDGSAVAVGRTGYPDWNQAVTWLGRAP